MTQQIRQRTTFPYYFDFLSLMLVSFFLSCVLCVDDHDNVFHENIKNTTALSNAPPLTTHTVNNRQLLGLRGGGGGLTTENDIALSISEVVDDFNNNIPMSNFSLPLHAHSGSHHIFVYIGSPPQRQTLIVDTGSRGMAFPCGATNGQALLSCKNCGIHASPYYNPTMSTTSRLTYCSSGCKLTGVSTCSLFGDYCEIHQKYTEGSSWTGTELEDLIWLGTENVMESIDVHMHNNAVLHPFGCQTSSKGLFRKQYADGILGLARHDTSLITAFAKSNIIHHSAFSLCMTQMGGLISIGGSLYPSRYHKTKMQVTPITREHGWYSIQIVKLTILNGGSNGNDRSHNHAIIDEEDANNESYVIDDPKHLKALNSGKGCIMDSGTTDTYLPKSLAKTIKRIVSKMTDGITDFSAKQRSKLFTYEEFRTLPNLKFEFLNAVSIEVIPDNYMEGIIDIDPTTGFALPWKSQLLLTNRIYLEESEGTVLGANAMFGYDILFDTHGHQMGIAKANCYDL